MPVGICESWARAPLKICGQSTFVSLAMPNGDIPRHGADGLTA